MDSFKHHTGEWIVHPYSFNPKGRREIGYVRNDYQHGLSSYGWPGEDKVILVKDSIYGNIDDAIAEFAIELAKQRCFVLNKIPKVLTREQEEENRKIDERVAVFNSELGNAFADSFEKAFDEIFGEASKDNKSK